MTTPPSSTPACRGFKFTSREQECRALDQNFAILKPSDFAPCAWSDSIRQAALAVLSPGWDGLASEKGLRFRVALLTQGACGFMENRSGEPPADCVAALCAAIGSLGQQLGDAAKAEAAIQKMANKAIAFASEHLGAFGRGASAAAGGPVLRALALAATPAQRKKMALRLLPRWQLAAPVAQFVDAGVFAQTYAALFSFGAEINDIFGFSPTPEASVAQRIQKELAAMPEGPVRAALFAEFERKTLDLAPNSPFERKAEAWDAKGVSPETLGELLNLIAALDEKTPGLGEQEALEWLRSHPALKEDHDRLAAAVESPPPSPASAPRKRL